MLQTRFALLALLPVLWGCSTFQEAPPPEPPRDPLSLALVAMEEERFRTAELHLRNSASVCPGTGSTVQSLLLLSVLHLDPRFPGRDAETAARYAARVIRRDRVPAPDVEVARGLYLAALELGAPPLDADRGEDGPRVGPRLAGFFHGASSGQSRRPPDGLPVTPCPGVDGVRTAGPLPRHPGPVLARSIGLARAALDSLETAAPGAGEPAAEETSEEERLRARVEQLEAELSRIRRLLRGGL